MKKREILIELRKGGITNIHGLRPDEEVVYMDWDMLRSNSQGGTDETWVVKGDCPEIGGYHEVRVCASSIEQAVEFGRMMGMINIRHASQRD